MTVDPTAGGTHLPSSTFVSAHTALVMILVRITACVFKVYNLHFTPLFSLFCRELCWSCTRGRTRENQESESVSPLLTPSQTRALCLQTLNV